MKQRVISAIIALIICIPIIIYGRTPFYLGASIIGLIGFMEFISLRSKKKEIPYFMKLLGVVSFIILMMSNWDSIGTLFILDEEVITTIIFLIIIPIIIFNKSKKYNIDDALFLLGGVLFLGIGFNKLVSIRINSLPSFVFLLLITICSDTFAYVIGRLIGKHKMSPTVSPNKTWEGFVGGLVFGTFISTVFYISAFDYSGNMVVLVLLVSLLSIVGQVGDLVFSTIKRNYEIKDFGNIMPGHGGVLDRLDSILFVILAYSYLVRFI